MKNLHPKKVLAIVAHPDDVEYAAGGTVASWSEQGAEISYIICTNGASGSALPTPRDELIEKRKKEQQEACETLGVKNCFYLDYEDGEIENDVNLRNKLVELIRKAQPDTVLTWDPSFLYAADYNFVNHMDHRTVGQAAIDAVFPMAGNHNVLTNIEAKPHQVGNLLLINMDKPNFYSDITSTIDKKINAYQKHNSQIGSMDEAALHLNDNAQNCGKQCGLDLAEPFVYIKLG